MIAQPYADGRAGIDAQLVRRLVAGQFPQWSGLSVRPVEHDGWDNRTYRLGDDMTVRLPTAAGYVPAIEKEHHWLPVLAPRLPVPIPLPLGLGVPAEGYPYPWAIRRWLTGSPADRASANNPKFALAVADFVVALQQIDTGDSPAAGAHSFYRGCSPRFYDTETRSAIDDHHRLIDTEAVAEVWNAAIEPTWVGPPTWFHGDIASGNLLVADGKLAAVLDFGTSGVGDPACDLVIAWTLFSGTARQAFRDAVQQDAHTWARARGWAVWKALISLPTDSLHGARSADELKVISEVVAEHRRLA